MSAPSKCQTGENEARKRRPHSGRRVQWRNGKPRGAEIEQARSVLSTSSQCKFSWISVGKCHEEGWWILATNDFSSDSSRWFKLLKLGNQRKLASLENVEISMSESLETYCRSIEIVLWKHENL